MTSNNFDSFGLSQDLNKSLARMKYATPTPIQSQAIPLALKGRDILGSAQTGTGKTAAFGIPLIEAILKDPKRNALVLTPTRELAKQVMDFIHQLLGPQTPIKTAFIIGGEAMHKQVQQIRQRPRIIVGTPGRMNDHLGRELKLNATDFLVLDETDKMLDMGFGPQLDKIVKHLPQKRQTLMFSATLPKTIVQLSSKYLHNPERVAVGATNLVAPKIKQEVIRISHEKKYAELISQLNTREGSVIIFVKTKYGTEKMARKLCQDGIAADALHGDLKQSKRNKVMGDFRNMKFRVLVATDIAARGLDVPHIEHVINYDLPQVAEDYIHRMGRTARAGAEGSALCFVSPEDGVKWRAIQKLLDPNAKPEPIHEKAEKSHKPHGPHPKSDKKRTPWAKKKRLQGGFKSKFGDKAKKEDRPYHPAQPKKKPHSDGGKPQHARPKQKAKFGGPKPKGKSPQRMKRPYRPGPQKSSS